MVNADAEIAKAEKKTAFTQAALKKLQDGIATSDYASKKPEIVREREAAKVRRSFV